MEKFVCSKCKNWCYENQLYKHEFCPVCGNVVVEPELLYDEIVTVMVEVGRGNDVITTIFHDIPRSEVRKFRKKYQVHAVYELHVRK